MSKTEFTRIGFRDLVANQLINRVNFVSHPVRDGGYFNYVQIQGLGSLAGLRKVKSVLKIAVLHL